MKSNIMIGVDFGGTKILTGAINNEGKVLCEPVKVLTGANDEAYKILKKVTDSIDEILKRLGVKISSVDGIGLGVTGPIDISNGVILECPQLPTMNFFPLKKKIEELYPVPVYMNNDANCLIYGEALFGSGSGFKNIVGFTLGTGLGCAIVLDKHILNGATESAGEIWTSPYKNGLIEDYVSGSGVSGIYRRICKENELQSSQEESALEIAQLAESNNKYALKTWEEFGEHLAVAISWTINLLDPEIVILGGSITNAFKFFSTQMEKNLRKQICPVPSEKTKVVCASLGANAGFIGAASLAIN